MLQNSLQTWKAHRNNLLHLLSKITKINILLTAPFVVKDAKVTEEYWYICIPAERKLTITTPTTVIMQELQRTINDNNGNDDPTYPPQNECPTFLLNKVDGNMFTNDLNHAYNKIVLWIKNYFFFRQAQLVRNL